ncbi:MAG TPA: metallopeptidase family protein [Verrucomicrobiae bacterium]
MSPGKLEPSADDIPWDDLLDRAAKVINKTIVSLPAPILEHAEKVATLLEKWPPDDDDMLGQFHGFEENHLSETLGPLFIFIGPIYELCLEEHIDFEDEVRTTYLHELGHFLGMDEDDLEERGLG